MDIYPQNLSRRHHAEVVRRRAAKGFAEPRLDEPLPRTPAGPMGRFWARGAGIADDRVALAAAASSAGARGVAAVTLMLGALATGIGSVIVGQIAHSPAAGFGAFGTGITALWLLGHGPLAQTVLRKAHRALSPQEIEEMVGRSQDDLSRAYLQLVQDAVRVEAPDATAERVREALGALGEAIDALPAVVIETQDTALFHAQAQDLRARAAAEADTVIADSLARQADSFEQRAESQEKSALLARRAAVLRDEIVAKIAALRDAVAAQQTGAIDATALTALSTSARSVARESQIAAAATQELERYLSPGEEAPVQRIGR